MRLHRRISHRAALWCRVPAWSAKQEKDPIMEAHGQNDSIIAYDGDNTPDPNTIPIPQWLHAWLEKEECQDARPKTKTVFSGRVKIFIWGCAGWKDLLVHYFIKDFGHG